MVHLLSERALSLPISRLSISRLLILYLPLLLLPALLGGCLPDVDGDGFAFPLDCAPFDPSIHPGAAEICDGIDQDCDGLVDEGVLLTLYADADQDGYGDPMGPIQACSAPSCFVSNDLDCNDDDPDVQPAAPEVCNGQDDDCNGAIDDGVGSYFRDADGDGFGTELEVACVATAGFVASRGDCDDTDPSTYPGAIDPPADAIDQDCGGTADPEPHVGLSATSLVTIQAALNAAAPGTTVWVGPGTYPEFHLDFMGKAVALESTDGALATVVNAGGLGTVMVFDSSEGPGTKVRGFTLTGGDTATVGGGVFMDGVSPTLDQLIVTANTAGMGAFDFDNNGAGMYLRNSSPRITHTEVSHNSLPLSIGAGMYLEDSDPVIFDCRITSNFQNSTQGGGMALINSAPLISYTDISMNVAYSGGAGIYMEGSSPTITRSKISNNSQSGCCGGGVHMETSSPTITWTTFQDNLVEGIGGALYAADSSPTIEHCLFDDNPAPLGGGAISYSHTNGTMRFCTLSNNGTSGGPGGLSLSSSSPLIENCIFFHNTSSNGNGGGIAMSDSSPTINNTLFVENGADRKGGGVYMLNSSPLIQSSIFIRNSGGGITTANGGGALYVDFSSPIIDHCVMVDNDANYEAPFVGEGFGMYVFGASSTAVVSNSILAYNLEHNIFNDSANPGTVTVEYSDLYNPAGHPNSNVALGATVLTVEPQFVAYSGGLPTDYHLALTSPLIDAGDPAAAPDPDGSRADMGAYGGPLGDDWNLDGDCRPDYFWPGTLADAPAGFDPADYDCNDRDASVDSGCP